jgi:hypothetical protein
MSPRRRDLADLDGQCAQDEHAAVQVEMSLAYLNAIYCKAGARNSTSRNRAYKRDVAIINEQVQYCCYRA